MHYLVSFYISLFSQKKIFAVHPSAFFKTTCSSSSPEYL